MITQQQAGSRVEAAADEPAETAEGVSRETWPVVLTLHALSFERRRDGTWRGFCTCGWELTGSPEQVHGRAATHDLDQ